MTNCYLSKAGGRRWNTLFRFRFVLIGEIVVECDPIYNNTKKSSIKIETHLTNTQSTFLNSRDIQ